jgi:hypothetical protein
MDDQRIDKEVPSATDSNRAFGWGLRRSLLAWQAGLLLEAGLRLAAFAVVLLLVLLATDFVWMFSQEALLILDVVALVTIGCVGLFELWRIARRTGRDAAIRADRLIGDRRQPVLTALELRDAHRRSASVTSDLERFLAGEATRGGAQSLEGLSWRETMPLKAIGRWAVVLAGIVAVALAVLLPSASPARVVLSRIMAPRKDIPPYSPYRFAVQPAAPSVIYGGTIELKTTISGGVVVGQVEMATRYGGGVHRSACFQEGGQRYAQRLEKVVNAVEFCFMIGRARSSWHRVELLLEPRIGTATIEIVPPAYSGLPRREFAAGADDIRGLKGSKVNMRVTCNRPLSDGLLTIRRAGDRPEEGEVIDGKCGGLNAVAFMWILRESARLEVQVRDVRGTTNGAPFVLHQVVTPDEAPRVTMSEPASFSLVTPGVVVPISGAAEDDLGVTRVELVRAVVGYRDRIGRVVDGVRDRRVGFDQRMDLAKLGVEPGDVIECYAEARDANPEMTGVGVSDVRRLEVISEADYREMLRVRTTVGAFISRFMTVSEAVRRLQDDYAAALATVERGGMSVERQRGLIEDLAAKTRATAAQLAQLGKDFAIYDLEKEFHAAADELGRSLDYNMQMIGRMKPGDPALAELLGRMAKNIGESGARVSLLADKAGQVAEVARLMEAAGEFQRLVRKQENLVRRLSRFAGQARTEDSAFLRTLGRDEDAIRLGFVRMVAAIRRNAKSAPPFAAKLAKDAGAVADAVEGSGSLPLMQESEDAAVNQDGDLSYRKASQALERLQDLLKRLAKTPKGSSEGQGQGDGEGDGEGEGQCNGFAAMCRGRGGMGFRPPDDLRSTLQQMLSALRRRSGNSGSGGSGGQGEGDMGMGGDANDGSWMGGSSLFNVPVIGPQRMSFGAGDGGSGSGAEGSGHGVGAGAANQVSGREVTSPASKGAATAESLMLEHVPEKYREAVKRYFSREPGGRP